MAEVVREVGERGDEGNSEHRQNNEGGDFMPLDLANNILGAGSRLSDIRPVPCEAAEW